MSDQADDRVRCVLSHGTLRKWVTCKSMSSRKFLIKAWDEKKLSLDENCSLDVFDDAVFEVGRSFIKVGVETLSQNLRASSYLELATFQRGPLDLQPALRELAVHFVTVRHHRQMDFCICDGKADISLCHLGVRTAAQPGDIVIGISPAQARRVSTTVDAERCVGLHLIKRP